MSVADQLGFRGEKSELLALPDQRWDHGTTAHPASTNRCGARELRSWLRGFNQADPGRLVTLECVRVARRAGSGRSRRSGLVALPCREHAAGAVTTRIHSADLAAVELVRLHRFWRMVIANGRIRP